MNSKAVSIVLEYVLLMSILSIFVFFISSTLNYQLEEVQTAKVIDNQFSDVASEISSQLVDIFSISPKNGYVRAKIYMPDKIGDYDYKAGFKEVGGWNYIYLESRDGKYRKYLGLGALTLNLEPEGFTYSLSARHEVKYTRKSPVFPKAVLIARPSTVLANETAEFDVSKSSAFGWWRWEIRLWNGSTIEGNMDESEVRIKVLWNETEFTNYCTYDATNKTAYCNVSLTVFDTVFNLNDTDSLTLAITKNTSVKPRLLIKKYVVPQQVAPGETAEVHVYLQGSGFMTEERASNLTVVHTMDTSGSMNDPTFYDSFSGNITPSVWTITFNVNDAFRNRWIIIKAYTNDDLSPWYDGSPFCWGWFPVFDCVYKDDAVKLWIMKPNGETLYASSRIPNSSENGVYYVDRVSRNEIGTWTFKVIAAVPKTIDLHLEIYKNLVKVATFSTTYTPSFETNSVSLPAGCTENDEYSSLWAYLTDEYKDDFFMWFENDFCENGLCLESDVHAGNHTLYVVPTRIDSTFYEGIVDISKIDSAKIAAVTFNGYLGDKDFVGLVSFNTSAYWYVVNSSPYLHNLTTSVENVTSIIKGLKAGGMTNFYDALVYANETINENTTYIVGTKPLIIFLSDGRPTTGITNKNKIIEKAEEIKSTKIGNENISICTIAFGYDADEDLLRDIASYKPGKDEKCFYTATSFEELIDAYKDIEKAFKIAAKNVTITDVVPYDLELVDVSVSSKGNASVGSPEVFDTAYGNAIRLNVSEVYISDEVELVFKVKANESGDYQLDVPGVSNVTYMPYPFVSIETVNLSVIDLRCSEVEKPKVTIS